MKIALLLMLLAHPVRAQSSRWITLAANMTYTVKADTSSVQRETMVLYKVWIKTELHKGQQVGKDDARIITSWTARDEVDCRARTLRQLSFLSYDDDGSVLESSTSPNSDFREPTPETIGEDVVVGVCKYIASPL